MARGTLRLLAGRGPADGAASASSPPLDTPASARRGAMLVKWVIPNGMIVMDEPVTYAGFWVRVGAALIDTLLIVLVTLPILYSIYGDAYFASDDLIMGGADFLLSWVFPPIAAIAFWSLKSATPGKMAFSVVIVDARTGAKPSVLQCIGRYLAYFVSMLPLFLGIIWVGIDSRKQGWHDKLANTVVIRQKPRSVTFSHEGGS